MFRFARPLLRAAAFAGTVGATAYGAHAFLTKKKEVTLYFISYIIISLYVWSFSGSKGRKGVSSQML